MFHSLWRCLLPSSSLLADKDFPCLIGTAIKPAAHVAWSSGPLADSGTRGWEHGHVCHLCLALSGECCVSHTTHVLKSRLKSSTDGVEWRIPDPRPAHAHIGSLSLPLFLLRSRRWVVVGFVKGRPLPPASLKMCSAEAASPTCSLYSPATASHSAQSPQQFSVLSSHLPISCFLLGELKWAFVSSKAKIQLGRKSVF